MPLYIHDIYIYHNITHNIHMKTRFVSIIMTLFVSLVIFSCAKGEDPFLQAGPSRIEIAADATSASFAIKSNVQWSISSSDTWASISPTS